MNTHELKLWLQSQRDIETRFLNRMVERATPYWLEESQKAKVKEIERQIAELEKENPTADTNYIPYQACPVCNGTGIEEHVRLSTSVNPPCGVCEGKRIIPMYKPEEKDGWDAIISELQDD